MTAPRKLIDDLTAMVRDALSAEASERSTDDRPKLSDDERKALAMSVLAGELKRIDQRQISNGRSRLTKPDESAVLAEVIAATCGLAQADLVLADPTVEDIVYPRFDQGFTYHSDGSCRRTPIRFDSDAAMRGWLSYLAATKGGTGRSFNAQQPLLVLQLGEGLRLAPRVKSPSTPRSRSAATRWVVSRSRGWSSSACSPRWWANSCAR